MNAGVKRLSIDVYQGVHKLLVSLSPPTGSQGPPSPFPHFEWCLSPSFHHPQALSGIPGGRLVWLRSGMDPMSQQRSPSPGSRVEGA